MSEKSVTRDQIAKVLAEGRKYPYSENLVMQLLDDKLFFPKPERKAVKFEVCFIVDEEAHLGARTFIEILKGGLGSYSNWVEGYNVEYEVKQID